MKPGEPRVIVFRSRLRPGVDDAYGRDAEMIGNLARATPGFVGATDFVAEDGERLALIEFESADRLAAWRDHPGASRRAATRPRRVLRALLAADLRRLAIFAVRRRDRGARFARSSSRARDRRALA